MEVRKCVSYFVRERILSKFTEICSQEFFAINRAKKSFAQSLVLRQRVIVTTLRR
jgi:hypothetical protein